MKETAFNAQIADEAADWVIRLDESPLTDLENIRFATWLKTSPLHVDEFLINVSLYTGIAASDVKYADALSKLTENSNSDVSIIHPQPISLPSDNKRKKTFLTAIAATVLLGLSTFLTVSIYSGHEAETPPLLVSTAVGQTQSLTLKDGSVVTMNTDTKLIADIAGHSRAVELQSGEAYFDVARDKARIFTVKARDAVIEVVGTEFNVRIIDADMLVKVTEGHVRIGQADPLRKGLKGFVDLVAGQSALFEGKSGNIKIETIDTSNVASWRSNKLIFEADSLANIVSEFNRYNHVKLVIVDETLLSKYYSGVFSTHDPDSFVTFLELSEGMEIVRTAGQIQIAKAK